MEVIKEKTIEKEKPKEVAHVPFSYTASHITELIVERIAGIISIILITVGFI